MSSPHESTPAARKRRRAGGRRHDATETISTRELILRQASELFARKGYYGTTTREITDAVGVRQPALFHHFPSKAAILAELLDYSLDNALEMATALSLEPSPAAPRLYRYLRADLEYLHRAPYNLTGVHTPDVMHDPGFRRWTAKLKRLHAALRSIIEQGVASAELRALDPAFAEEMVMGATEGNIRFRARHPAQDPVVLAEAGTAFILCGLLRDPSTYDAVRAMARTAGEANSAHSDRRAIAPSRRRYPRSG